MGKHNKAKLYPIAAEMRQAGVTLAAISAAVGVPQATVKNWFYPPKMPRKDFRRQEVCDCGNPATRIGVPLSFLMANEFVATALYDLCEDCWQLENEPIQTRGEAVWNR